MSSINRNNFLLVTLFILVGFGFHFRICKADRVAADIPCPTTDIDCRAGRSPASPICSSRGTCSCGECSCDSWPIRNEKTWGRYCECDNFSCPKHKGEMCSGGLCYCETCLCNPGKFGEACQYNLHEPATTTPRPKPPVPPQMNFCRAPGESRNCSGNGDCYEYGCECSDNFSGDFCEKCPTCFKENCSKYQECVYCKVRGGDCKGMCGPNVPPVQTVKLVKMNEMNDKAYCHFRDETDCKYFFVFGIHQNGKEYIRAQKGLKCPGGKVSNLAAGFSKLSTRDFVWTIAFALYFF